MRWKEYYDPDNGYRETVKQTKRKKKSREFIEGSIIGCLLDMDRGILSFFKDGKDLGQAVCQPELKTGKLFPFIQIQEVALLSIFHPSIYPQYRDPVIAKEEEIKEPEPQPRRLSATKKKSIDQ